MNLQFSKDPLFIADFLMKSWDIYNVSPLYRLEYSDIYLKRCSKWLREQIVNYVSEKKKDYEYFVQFSLIKSLKIGDNENDYLKVNMKIYIISLCI